MKQEHKLIYELEISLLNPQTRRSITQLKLLIADEFIEYGASGLIYNKNDLLDSLPEEEPKSYLVNNFSVLELSSEVMLATYKVTVTSKSSLRSSLWQYKHNRWQMVFHQGTPCHEE
ncbi:nuclear transport factor 2 family protein [Legionella pneumophila]|uniref:nuclear transport factor 2 family protein n=1 Tax=Legionella pneumophila TaxID=446 RepID=UPI002244EE56|nr:DUF4440 domain-containing protein [Legionella pneumophila]MCW8405308.1 DUF4440 domain-containing protein [Legionella pneumophila]